VRGTDARRLPRAAREPVRHGKQRGSEPAVRFRHRAQGAGPGAFWNRSNRGRSSGMRLVDTFNLQRFFHVLIGNLILLHARKIGFASLGLAGIGLICYAVNVSAEQGDNGEVAMVMFGILLLGGGSIFTSMIYNDMHHPLERFQYLMLPCSNLERF